MAYTIKHGRLKSSGVKVEEIKHTTPKLYQETPEEIAARDGDRGTLSRVVCSDGMIRYCVPGLLPDTAETLEADGLIKQAPGYTDVYYPDNLRVLAWQIGVNECAASKGMSAIFPGIPEPTILDDAPSMLQ